jgi:hypothetical protein
MRALLFVALAGCGTSESSALLTDGITADMSAQTTDNASVHVVVELFEGSPDKLIFVDLQAGDTLIATSESMSVPLTKVQLATIISYVADLPGSAGETVAISFQRTIDAGAPQSMVALPTEFDLNPPPTTMSRASDAIFTYTTLGANDMMGWEASGDCIQAANGNGQLDNGTVTIPANAITGTGSCMVTVSIDRVKATTVDPAFLAGELSAYQVRTVQFTSTP